MKSASNTNFQTFSRIVKVTTARDVRTSESIEDLCVCVCVDGYRFGELKNRYMKLFDINNDRNK